MMMEPTERYKPPPFALSSFLISRTSLRKAFFSEAFKLDLSSSLISMSLSAIAMDLSESVWVIAGRLFALSACMGRTTEANNNTPINIRSLNLFMMTFWGE